MNGLEEIIKELGNRAVLIKNLSENPLSTTDEVIRNAPSGTHYLRTLEGNNKELWIKNSSNYSDWSIVLRQIPHSITGGMLSSGSGLYDETRSYLSGELVFWGGQYYRAITGITGGSLSDQSNTPDVSPNWIPAPKPFYAVYPSTEQIFSTTATILELDQEYDSSLLFSLQSGGVVQFEEGFEGIISLNVSFESLNSLNNTNVAFCYFQINTGSGWVDIPERSFHVFHGRPNGGSLSFPISVSTGDLIRVAMIRTNGSKDVTSIVAGCSLCLFSTSSVRGERGAIGPKGDTGASGDFEWVGNWSAGSYSKQEVVSYGGSSYVSNINNNTATPGLSINWDLIAQKGTDGSGSTMSILQDGVAVGSPHSILDFLGDLTVLDQGATAQISIDLPDLPAIIQYKNTDVTTNLNVAGGVRVPILGSLDRLRGTLFVAGVDNRITINRSGWSGWVKVSANIYFESTATRPNLMLQLKVNNINVGMISATGYIRNNSGHNESSCSIPLFDIFVKDGDTIELSTEEGANSGIVTMTTAGASFIRLEESL